MVSAKPGERKAPLLYAYNKPTTGRQAVSCKGLELDGNVGLQIELLASQSDRHSLAS